MPKLAPICACSLCSSCRVEWRIEDQLFSSQNSDLNKEQLNKIEQKARAKNTKKATHWGVKKFSGSQKSKSKGLALNYAKVLR